MDNLEKNRVIAEYMGESVAHSYHTSWDLFMPVWEKFRQFDAKQLENGFDENAYHHKNGFICYCISFGSLSESHEKLVEAIIWLKTKPLKTLNIVNQIFIETKMSEIKENSIVQIISGPEIAYKGCCMQVETIQNGNVFGFIAYPLKAGESSQLIDVEVSLSDVVYIGESQIKPQ